MNLARCILEFARLFIVDLILLRM